MAKNLHPPKELLLQGNLKENFRKFKQQFQLYLTATELDEKEENVKSSTLLHVIGTEALEIYNTFSWNEDGDEEGDDQKTDKILRKFERYCNPRKNVAYERHIFNKRCQGESEPIDTYVTELKILASSCEFENLKDSLIRDRIVCGVKSDSVRSRLLREVDLTLERALDICRASETSDLHMKGMAGSLDEVSLNAVKGNPRLKQCHKCGNKHKERNCPAYGKKCLNCGQRNHFAKMCSNRKMDKSRHNKKTRKVHPIDTECSDDTDSDYLGMLFDLVNSVDKDWIITGEINNKEIPMLVDTGARCNVISSKTLKKLNVKANLDETQCVLRSFSGHSIKPMGLVKLKCTIDGNLYKVKFQVVHQKVPTVLSANTCTSIGLVKKMFPVSTNEESQNIMEKYRDVFEGIGCLPGKHKIHIDKSVKPVVHAPRKVPVKLRTAVEKELHRMESEGIIVRETEPTDWVNSMVTVVKPNGDVRICLDPKDLNKAVKRQHFPLKTVEDVMSRIPGAKYFSRLDATSSFWQIELDEESSKLCTFNTPFGRFRYLRLAFGINSAPEVMQCAMSQIVENIEGVEVIMDDILITGRTLQEHDERLEKVFKRARKYNLKLNKAKCQLRKKEVPYVGHLLTDEGVKPDPEKIRAVKNMQAPTNKKELMTFLGFIQYLAKFLPNLSTKSGPLRELLKKDIVFAWGPEQDECFSELKSMVINAPVLKYFDPNEHITLTVDSSSKGLGAAILQNGRPVAFASQALTSTQQRYSQIEKETLAIVFGVKKFRHYIYGQKITVESDHKPLESIFKKGLNEVPLRLQRMLYDLTEFDLEVVFKPGKSMYIADTLSRNFQNEKSEKLLGEEYNIAGIEEYVSMSQEMCKKIEKATESDSEMQLLQDRVINGWPQSRCNVPDEIKLYWNYRDEISIVESLLFKGNKIIIPKSMRNQMLEYIHESHLGIVKCKARARDCMYWPGMNGEIEDKISKCYICAKSQAMNPKEPMIESEIPDRPYCKIGVDIFEIKGKQYLISVDYFSKWPEISKLDNMTSRNVIGYLKSHMSKYGIPEEVVTDNAQQFCSSDFKKFAKEYGFKHTTSSPRYAQANGQAERTVRTVKNLIKKSNDPYLAMLDYRNTPIEGIELSPAQMLMGRRLRTKLPVAKTLLKPKNSSKISENLKARQQTSKENYDKYAGKTLKPLKTGENVMFRHDNKWEHGTVSEKHQSPRSYVVKSPQGKQYRRNRKHLRPTKSEPDQLPTEDLDIPDQHRPTVKPYQAGKDQDPVTKPYVTRSGRTVRQPDRYS